MRKTDIPYSEATALTRCLHKEPSHDPSLNWVCAGCDQL